MLLEEIARTSEGVAQTRSRLQKIARLAETLRRLRPQEVPVAVAYLSGELPAGTIGVGWASLRDLPSPGPVPPTLELLDVHAVLEDIRRTAGPGSQGARRELLHDLFARATDLEQRFLRGLLLGELRQGALEGIMVEGVARASGVTASDVRRAAMLAGDLGAVAAAALGEGREALDRFRLTVLQPVLPMLAHTAEDLGEALERAGLASVEWKLDGARLQVHRSGDEVRAFTRNLADVTGRVPEVVRAVRGLPLESAVLDGEVIALRPDGRPYPFQVSMSRFGTRAIASRSSRAGRPGPAGVGLSSFFFDLLHLDGDDLLAEPLRRRIAAMHERIPQEHRVPRVEEPSTEVAGAFLEDVLARGHEGVMVKALDAPYEAGRRGAGWLKVKRAHTLDLVVLAAEWGHGRRHGWLSNLHLGARDPATGGFVMLGKTFKGMTDEMLAWQTERLQALETGREGIVVHVRPELVVEVAFDGLQGSTRYPAGVALRFARVKGYRHDKTPRDADTIDTVLALRPDLSPS